VETRSEPFPDESNASSVSKGEDMVTVHVRDWAALIVQRGIETGGL
jgi:hypothetical protein